MSVMDITPQIPYSKRSKTNLLTMREALGGKGRDHVPTAEKPKQKKSPGKMTRYECCMLGCLGTMALLVATETTGAVITELTNDIPMNVRTIGTDLTWPWTLVRTITEEEIPAPLTFDPKAKESIVEEGTNAVPMTEAELQSLSRNTGSGLVSTEIMIDSVNKTDVIFPVRLKQGERVTFFRNDYIQKVTVDGVPHDYLLAPGIDLQCNKNDIVPLFVDQAEIFQLPPALINGEEYFMGLAVRQIMPDGSILAYEITARDYMTDLAPADTLRDAPLATFYKNQVTPNIPYVFDAKNGVTLSISVQDNRLVAPDLLKIKRDKARITISATSNKYTNISINPITRQNPETDTSEAIFLPQE